MNDALQSLRVLHSPWEPSARCWGIVPRRTASGVVAQAPPCDDPARPEHWPQTADTVRADVFHPRALSIVSGTHFSEIL